MLDLDKNSLEVHGYVSVYRVRRTHHSYSSMFINFSQNLLENPFVAAIYKRTEPYMGEFLKLEPKRDLEAAGFEVVETDSASRSHRVFVARKPTEFAASL
jgi:hypothetical protein